MKQLTEAQVMGFRGSMPPRTATRRAIEEYHEKRALRHELEL
ncbi:PA3496 family putative envelope integrity protein [Aeromonas jandaei]|nr:hypothetical protein [Aeromonas jandaei]